MQTDVHRMTATYMYMAESDPKVWKFDNDYAHTKQHIIMQSL